MNKKLMKKNTAVTMAFALIGGTVIAPTVDKNLFANVITANAETSTATYDSSTRTLTLSGNVVKEDVQAWARKSVQKIVCADNTVLPVDCSKLFYYITAKEIDLSKASTVNTTNMNSMFAYCGLETLKLGNFDTSKVTDMEAMFCSCSSLKSLDLSTFNTSKVQSMNSMFSNCGSLETLDLGTFDTSNVTDMKRMFWRCFSLTSLDLSTFNTSKVQSMDGMFEKCDNLTFLDITNFDTSSVTCMCYMFCNCYEITSLDLSSFDTSNVTDMSYMFEYCSKLTSLDVSSFNTSKVIDMTSMFENCRSLASLDLNNFDTSNVERMEFMFCNCYDLVSLDIEKFNTSGTKYMRAMFGSCSKLADLDVTNFDIAEGTDQYYVVNDCPAHNVTYKGTKLTLDKGMIGLSIVFTKDADLKSVVMNGPAGELKADISELMVDDDGNYTVSYYVNAVQVNEKISFSFYDSNGKKINVFKELELWGREYKGIVSKSCLSFSVNDYIAASKKYALTDKERQLIDAIDNYCKAAENYFKGKENKIEGIDAVKVDNVSEYAPLFGTSTLLSLVLNSATSMRIYTNADKVEYKGNIITPVTGKNGVYYEIANIPAQKLLSKYKVTIDGTEYEFSPMTYVYRVLNDKNSSEKLKEIAKATYVYGKAAKEYIGE